jgi:L-seryl-tRNA(Ser) seleniumtransferase
MHDEVNADSRRQIPGVNAVLESIGDTGLPRPLVVAIVRQELKLERRARQASPVEAIIERIQKLIASLRGSRLQPVINGTGIIIHTNLGRAPMSSEAADQIRQIAASYTNLEHDLAKGARGARGGYVEQAMALLCRSEAAIVVNNCAAALVLIIHHFTKKKPEVIISRGEMVQIGGGFRIGKILESAGATLREVGATHKTTIDDYAAVIGPNTSLLLRVHRSNFVMSGFVDEPASMDLGMVARKNRIPFVEDLGSGAVFDTRQDRLEEHEPTAADAIKQGADLVCFSGDKLFGGPQAGIIVGRKKFISQLKGEPLFRALRCDKLVLAGLQTTIDLHLSASETAIPVRSLLRLTKDELRARAAAMLVRLRGLPIQINVGRGAGNVGGGSLAQSVIPSVALEIRPEALSAKEFAARLRAYSPPIIGYVAQDSVKLDLRTIFPWQDDTVVDGIRGVSSGSPSQPE